MQHAAVRVLTRGFQLCSGANHSCPQVARNQAAEKVNLHPTAHYIAARTRELAVPARYDGCEDWACMLELATIEAENTDLRYWLVYGR